MRARQVLAVAIAATSLLALPISAQDDPKLESAHEALKVFTEAVASGEPEVIADVLAPEYQIMRANGIGYDRDGYLESALPRIDPMVRWQHEDVVATTSDDLLVVRYHLVIDETIDGTDVTRRAPRLTVFRRGPAGWLVVAHANFARPLDD